MIFLGWMRECWSDRVEKIAPGFDHVCLVLSFRFRPWCAASVPVSLWWLLVPPVGVPELVSWYGGSLVGVPELVSWYGGSCLPRQSAVAVRGRGHCGINPAAIVFTELLLTPPLFCQTSQSQLRLPRCVCSYA